MILEIQIKVAEPNVVLLSSPQHEVHRRLSGSSCCLIELRSGSIEDITHNIEILGDIFDRRENAPKMLAQYLKAGGIIAICHSEGRDATTACIRPSPPPSGTIICRRDSQKHFAVSLMLHTSG